MAVGLKPAGQLQPVQGIKLSAVSAGIYARKRPDLALIALDEGTVVSGVFTANDFSAAPVMVARSHMLARDIRFCLINSGNANAGTGDKGIQAVYDTCGRLAELCGQDIESILPFSTGVIGEDLPVDRICNALPLLLEGLSDQNWEQCAGAIMTTDTLSKGISRQTRINNQTVTITGIAKGSGMIRPDMATMLAFIGMDAAVEKSVLDRLLADSVETSFNRICVDGDTSTNDACVLMATGKAGNIAVTNTGSPEYQELHRAVSEVCACLARAIVRDGEGATKFITINVSQGGGRQECLDVAYAVATSPLVKTAFFASDPNWGRILAAVGRAGLKAFDINRVAVTINGCRIVEGGMRAAGYTEDSGKHAMSADDILLEIDLGRGRFTETVWTCDLSHEYVRINAEYRS